MKKTFSSFFTLIPSKISCSFSLQLHASDHEIIFSCRKKTPLELCYRITLYIFVFILLTDRPDPPFDLELTDHLERSVQLTWIPGNDNNSPITSMFCNRNWNVILLNRIEIWSNILHMESAPFSYSKT